MSAVNPGGLPLPPSSRQPLAPPPPVHGSALPGSGPGFVAPSHLQFRSVHGLGVALRVVFLLWVVFAGFALWVQVQERSAIQERIESGQTLDPFEPIVVDGRADAVGLLLLLAYVLTGIVFLVWFHRLYRNVPAVSADGRPTQYSSGWSIGWWLIPVASWWFPKTMVDEVYRRSTPPGFRPGPAPALYLVWWLFFVLSNLPIAAWLVRVESYEDLRTVNLIESVAVGCQLVAALFASVVVEELSKRQHERFDEVVAASHVPFAPGVGPGR